MVDDPRQRITTLRQRIDSSQEISDDDRDVLLEFSRQLDLLRSEYSDYRHEKLLRHCTRMAENIGGLAAALDDRDAAESILNWINREYDNENTNLDYRLALRAFGKRTLKRDDVPDALAWIPTGTSNSHDPSPDRAEMLEWDEVKTMIDQGARNARDRALIAVAFDVGPRGMELYEMRVGDVLDHELGLQLAIDGKTGERQPTLIPSVPYLQKWLGEHPYRDDPTAPLWSKFNEPEQASYHTFLEYFKKSAERVGLEKPVTPTNFRKSNATWLARQGANAALIEDRQGRNRGSQAVAHYVARFGPDNEAAQYAQLHGVEVDTDEPDDIGPVTCPRCDKETPQDEAFCVWCNQALDPGAVERIQAKQSDHRFELLEIAKEHPEFLDRVEEMTELVELVDDNPEIAREARRYADSG